MVYTDEKKKQYDKEYRARPENKEKMKKYHKKKSYLEKKKQYMKEYRSTPEHIEYQRKYYLTKTKKKLYK